MKKRLDIYCVEHGLFETRHKALAAIMAGIVLVNGKVADKAGFMVKPEDKIELADSTCPYVSRGGLKLKAAIDYFKIELKDKICLDIGVATGGFSDCMLKEGAKKVYGVDVGKGQIHEKIFSDKRFHFIPNTNARFLKKEIFEEDINFVAVDVSFISLKLIIPPLIKCLNKKTDIVLLVKPQFELEPKDLKKGIVKNDELRHRALNDIIDFAKKFNELKVIGFTDSPVKGVKGNLEFLLHIRYE
jgi:23S rRNA (cytidine1920-2'-O)/16S rRNA (cytidine1409-2'-O)-methyltransferase